MVVDTECPAGHMVHQFPRFEVLPLHPVRCRAQYRTTAELGPIIANYHLGQRALESQSFKFPLDPDSAQ